MLISSEQLNSPPNARYKYWCEALRANIFMLSLFSSSVNYLPIWPIFGDFPILWKSVPHACTVLPPCLHRTCMTAGSETNVSAATTSTTASGTTAFFMHPMLKPYTLSQNAMRSWCLRVSLTAARLMLQRSGYTVVDSMGRHKGAWNHIDNKISIPLIVVD